MDERRVPGRALYWVGGGVAALSLAVAVAVVVVAFVNHFGRIDDFQRVRVPGEGTVQLSGTGGYTIYYEAPGVAEGPLPPVSVTLTEAVTGQRIPLSDYDGSLTYEVPDHEGRAVFTFRISTPGAYVLRAVTDGPGRGTMAVGRSLAPKGIVVAIFGAVLVLILGLSLAAVLITVTAVKRHRAARAQP